MLLYKGLIIASLETGTISTRRNIGMADLRCKEIGSNRIVDLFRSILDSVEPLFVWDSAICEFNYFYSRYILKIA